MPAREPALSSLSPERSLAEVSVRAITKLYGPTPALRGVSAEFRAGSITLLGGPNGAGKSTLLSILGTRTQPSRGQVAYTGPNRESLDRFEVRARMGWVSHATHAYAELSGIENVLLAAELQGVGSEAVERVRERVGLGRFGSRPVSTLSRGQAQRVALARALVHEPGFLLLDEPWTGLDRHFAGELEAIVREERERGALIVIVSHEPGLAERLGAREMTLRAGQLSTSTDEPVQSSSSR